MANAERGFADGESAMGKQAKKRQLAASINTVQVVNGDFCLVREGIGIISVHDPDTDEWTKCRRGWDVVQETETSHRGFSVSYNGKRQPPTSRAERRREAGLYQGIVHPRAKGIIHPRAKGRIHPRAAGIRPITL
jgi:hypothetical protein